MNESATKIILNLPEKVRKDIETLFSKIHFTQMQQMEIINEEADLTQWDEESFVGKIKIEDYIDRKDGRGGDEYIKELRNYMSLLRKSETDYSSFFPKVTKAPKTKTVANNDKIVLSRCPCPVDGEKTRCCRLRTLDAVMQCGFGCSYCSVQAFYSENEIRIVQDLEKKLEDINIDEGVWHIGTGQASDSLLLGDDYNTLSSLSSFAERHPGIIIELKSKAFRADIFKRKWPKNMVFTWSLNAETIIEKEEHYTSPLEKRIECAMRARDNGNKVGFHIHPVFYFKGWREEYKKVVSAITSNFSPDDILMISMGTLTFTKAVLKRLRERGKRSRVLEMELEKTAGKYSYPLDKKEEMFSTIYSYFPLEYKKDIFFYLCMEDPSLWSKVFGREYKSDSDFEKDMKKNYYRKLSILDPSEREQV